MTIDLLIEAMELLKNDFHPDYKEKVIDETLTELYNVRIETNRCRNIWRGAVYVVATTDVLEQLNERTYDCFGKIIKKYSGMSAQYKYIDAVHDIPGFEYMSHDILLDSFSYLNDLWHDNEENDSNNPDGTFKNSQPKFKVLRHEYLNTGGHCMVSVFTVWLPDKNQTVYMMVNEEGCTMSTVDYISNEVDIDDYDHVQIKNADWGRVTGHEEYFDLYRYCLIEYTKSDCRYFGNISEIPYHLLTDDLQKQVPAGYCEWLEKVHGRDIATDGEKIIIDPDFNN